MEYIFSITVVLLTLRVCFVEGSHNASEGLTGKVNINLESPRLVNLDGFTVSCRLTSSPSIDVEFEWYWETPAPLNDPGYYFEWKPRESGPVDNVIAYKSTLKWKDGISQSDKKMASGIIHAVGTHVGDTTKSTQCSDVHINIIWKPGKPSVQIQERIILGEKTQLTCEIADLGSPNGTIVWVKDGFNHTEVEYSSSAISFTVTRELHKTIWQCFYYNMVGEGEKSNDTELDVLWPPGKPTFAANRNVSNLEAGDKVEFTCSLNDSGNPKGQRVWTKNGHDQIGQMHFNETIDIQVTEKDKGSTWGCYFENNVPGGLHSDVFTLNVMWKPKQPIVEADLDISNLSVWQTLQLTCNLNDKGNPSGKVWWKEDGIIQADYKTHIIDLLITLGHNDTMWSCFYNNSVGPGIDSQSKLLIVSSTIPVPDELNVINKTAKSLNISIDKPETHSQNYQYMKLLWASNESMEWIEETVNSSITFKLFLDLEPETYYTMQFAFVHGNKTGYFKEITDSTEVSPVSGDPVITREWLTVLCDLNFVDLDSVPEVVMVVCNAAGTNCISETKTVPTKKTSKRSIQEQEFRITVKEYSFSTRLVNVTVYDGGVLVYDYSDNIDAPVAAIVLIILGAVLIVVVIIIIIVIIIKKTGKKKPSKEVEEEISPYGHTNPAMTSESRTGTGHATKAENPPPVYSVVNKGKQLAPIAASPADGDVYSQVDWSKKTKRPSLKGLPMSTKAIDKITFSKKDGSVNMLLEVRKKFTGDIEINVCREGDQSSKSKESKQHVGGTKNVVMVLPIEETSEDKYTIRMKFIAKGQMVQEVNLTYPYEQNAVHVTVMNDAYVTSGTDVKASEMPEYSEVNKSKKAKGSEMPIYSEVNKPKKKKKAAEEQPYEDVETKNQSSHNERSTNAVSPSNAEVAVEGVPPHPPRKGAPKEGVMYAELDLNSSGATRLLPRLGSKSPAQEPVIYADVRPGQNDVV